MSKLLSMPAAKRRSDTFEERLLIEIEKLLSAHAEPGDDADRFGDKLVALLQNEITRRKRAGLLPAKFKDSKDQNFDPSVQ